MAQTAEEVRKAADAEIAALKAQYEAQIKSLKSDDTKIRPIEGVFTATVRKENKTETKKFGFKASHPPHLNSPSGRSLHAETLISIANGSEVDADVLKKYSLLSFDKAQAQAELQHLVDVGYLYLEEV